MSWAATIYVDENCWTYGASETDQAGRHNPDNRTVGGRPVECAGKWCPSQMSYAPYLRAVRAAAGRAASRTVLDLIVGAVG